MADLAEITPQATVLDPTCGAGGFLIEAHRRGAARLRGVEIDPELVALCRLNLALVGADPSAATVTQGDAFLPAGEGTAPADIILANPPFSVPVTARRRWRARRWRRALAGVLGRAVPGGGLVAAAARGAAGGGAAALDPGEPADPEPQACPVGVQSPHLPGQEKTRAPFNASRIARVVSSVPWSAARTLRPMGTARKLPRVMGSAFIASTVRASNRCPLERLRR